MKTPEEIKKGLEHCCNDAPCLECEYADQRDHRYTCEDALLADALAYIQQLEAAHRTEYCEEADYDCKALGEARKRIAELEAQVPKWISVEERLPENDDDVLIITELGISMGYYDIYRDYWLDYVNSESNIVTHWMPLPEGPKEG